MEWSPPIEIGLELELSIVLKKLVICAIQSSLSFAFGKGTSPASIIFAISQGFIPKSKCARLPIDDIFLRALGPRC